MITMIKESISDYRKSVKEKLFVTAPELILVLVVIGLIIVTISICVKFTRGSISITELKDYLNTLQSKFSTPSEIDAEQERTAIEILLNRLKTSSSPEFISSNEDLKNLFASTCIEVKSITDSKEAGSRSSWQKLQSVVCDFNEFYYPQASLA